MSFQYQNPSDVHVPRKSNLLWIILGVIGGMGLLVVVLCCGAGAWLASFPGVSPVASQPFDVSSIPVPAFVETQSSKTIEGVGERREVILGNGTGYGELPGNNTKLWIYLPPGKAPLGSLPCVLICGAGSTMLEGMRVGDGDELEHIPYVKAGLVVVAYDLDGPNETGSPEPRSYNTFRASMAGLVNARNALEYAIAKVPEVNPKQLFAAGHSSAGTVALLFAEHEPRLAGCVAYAPAVDLKARFPGFVIRAMGSALPDLPDFVVRSSPRTHEQQLNCPVMIFHAADDSNCPIEASREMIQRLQGLGKEAVLVEVPTGDHYQPMLDSGIPAGIQWMKQQINGK